MLPSHRGKRLTLLTASIQAGDEMPGTQQMFRRRWLSWTAWKILVVFKYCCLLKLYARCWVLLIVIHHQVINVDKNIRKISTLLKKLFPLYPFTTE